MDGKKKFKPMRESVGLADVARRVREAAEAAGPAKPTKAANALAEISRGLRGLPPVTAPVRPRPVLSAPANGAKRKAASSSSSDDDDDDDSSVEVEAGELSDVSSSSDEDESEPPANGAIQSRAPGAARSSVRAKPIAAEEDSTSSDADEDDESEDNEPAPAQTTALKPRPAAVQSRTVDVSLAAIPAQDDGASESRDVLSAVRRLEAIVASLGDGEGLAPPRKGAPPAQMAAFTAAAGDVGLRAAVLLQRLVATSAESIAHGSSGGAAGTAVPQAASAAARAVRAAAGAAAGALAEDVRIDARLPLPRAYASLKLWGTVSRLNGAALAVAQHALARDTEGLTAAEGPQDDGVDSGRPAGRAFRDHYMASFADAFGNELDEMRRAEGRDGRVRVDLLALAIEAGVDVFSPLEKELRIRALVPRRSIG